MSRWDFDWYLTVCFWGGYPRLVALPPGRGPFGCGSPLAGGEGFESVRRDGGPKKIAVSRVGFDWFTVPSLNPNIPYYSLGQ